LGQGLNESGGGVGKSEFRGERGPGVVKNEPPGGRKGGNNFLKGDRVCVKTESTKGPIQGLKGQTFLEVRTAEHGNSH